MKKKIGLFLFALAMSASYASAEDTACYDTCLVKYDDCLTKPWLTQNYCIGRMQNCFAACDGAAGNPIP